MDLAMSVALALRDIAIGGQVEMYMDPIYVGPSTLMQVASCIGTGEMSVVYEPSKTIKFSTYTVATNTFTLRTKDVKGLRARATILHEAVHAINDLNKQAGLVKDFDEAAAYIASGMYLVRNKIDPYRAKGPMQAGMTVANLMIEDGETWVSTDKLNYVIAAVRKHKWYSANFTDIMTYDGVEKPKK